VFLQAHAGHADFLPLAFERHLLHVRQVAGGADVRFVEIEPGEAARLPLARDAVEAEDFVHGVGPRVPLRVLDGLRVGVIISPRNLRPSARCISQQVK
jgi:hypothetical protein